LGLSDVDKKSKMRVLIWIFAVSMTILAGDQPQMSPDPDSLTQLGLAYAQGHGVPKDYARSLSYFEKAAQSGHPVAQKLKSALERKLSESRVPASR